MREPPVASEGGPYRPDRVGRRSVDPLDDHVRAGDWVVALDVPLLRGHPALDPGPARRLTVALDAAREPHVIRRLDPDADVVVVAEHPMEGAHALHDDDARRLDLSHAPGPAPVPVPGRVPRPPAAQERL